MTLPSGWLDDSAWEAIQGAVPIACVDVVPVRRVVESAVHEVGLIRRITPFDGRIAWCQIGGRIQREETVRESILRHLHGTLSGVDVELPADPQPEYVMQWFPTLPSHAPPGVRYGLDPRRHAVALSFAVVTESDPMPVPGGEALEFSWFRSEEVAGLGSDLWPGTESLIEALLTRLASNSSLTPLKAGPRRVPIGGGPGREAAVGQIGPTPRDHI